MNWNVFIISIISGLTTAVGALVVCCLPRISRRILSALLGLAAGVMIAISTMDLIPAAVEYGSYGTAIIGFISGGSLMLWLDSVVSHVHIPSSYMGTCSKDEECLPQEDGCGNRRHNVDRETSPVEYAKIGMFVALGIALHNIPEGLAVGAGYEAAPKLGLLVAVAIAMHNIPEGISIAAFLRMGGGGWVRMIGITMLAGLCTPIGTLIGFVMFNISPVFISFALGLAAGAMVYIASDELIPESHRHHSHYANVGIMSGILLTMLLELL